MRRARRTKYVFKRVHKDTGEEVECTYLLYPEQYSEDPGPVHRDLTTSKWEVVGIGIPLSEWRRRKTSSNAKWEFDMPMIHYAMALYGADRLPFLVKKSDRQGGKNGHYIFRGYKSHKIMVKGWLTPESANGTLHHEIQHAAQTEEVIRDLPKSEWYRHYTQWQRAQHQIPYKRRPIEIDANRAMNERKDKLCLVRTVT